MKTFATTLTIVAMTISTGPMAGAPAGTEMPRILAAEQARHEATGTIKEVRADKGRVKLSHGPVKSLGWGPMTMMFTVEDPAALAGLKSGDEVHFEFYEKNGRYIITSIGKH